MPPTFDLDDLLSYHSPDSDQSKAIANVRMAARQFAQTILDSCPNSADRSHAIRLVRTAMFFANASIVTHNE